MQKDCRSNPCHVQWPECGGLSGTIPACFALPRASDRHGWRECKRIVSGKDEALPLRPPLRTGHESHPSSGSSHSSAPRGGTEQLLGIYRNSSSGEVRRPRRVERGCHASYLDVSLNRDGHGTEEPKALMSTIARLLRGKYPTPVSLYVKVFLSNPTGTFHGVSTHSPLPEESPNLRVYR